MNKNYVGSGLALAAIAGGVYFYSKKRSSQDNCGTNQDVSCSDAQENCENKLPVDYITTEEVSCLFTDEVKSAIVYISEGCDESPDSANNRLAERFDPMASLASSLQNFATSKLGIIESSAEKEIVYRDILEKFEQEFKSCYTETPERKAFFDQYISGIKSTLAVN